jgi:cell division protein FtsN
MKSKTLILLAATLTGLCLCLFAAGFLAGYMAGFSDSRNDTGRQTTLEIEKPPKGNPTQEVPPAHNATGSQKILPVTPPEPPPAPSAKPAPKKTAETSKPSSSVRTASAGGAPGTSEAADASGASGSPEPVPKPKMKYAVQTGAFLYENHARSMAEELAGLGYDATVFQHRQDGKDWFIVRFGEFPGPSEAAARAREFRAAHDRPAVVSEFDTGRVIKIAESKPVYLLQVAAFAERSQASVRAGALVRGGRKACVVKVFNDTHKAWYLVVLRAFKTRSKADVAGKKYAGETGGEYYVQPLAADLWKARKYCPK